jgi:hypothetical protein
MFGNIKKNREREQKRKDEESKNLFNDYSKYDQRIQNEAARLRSDVDAAKVREGNEVSEMFKNPPQGLTNEQSQNMRNQQQQQVNRDIQNYNRMLSGQQSVKGVRGGVNAAQQAELARVGSESMTDFERGLNDLEAQNSFKKLIAQYVARQGAGAEQSLLNQQAYDKIMGYVQNQKQNNLTNRADKFFYNS